MITSFDDDCKELTIRFIEKVFDWSIVVDFKHSYRPYMGKSVDLVTVDLSTVERIDSAALGSLINLKKDFRDRVNIQLTNYSPTLKKIFLVSGMNKKFRLI